MSRFHSVHLFDDSDDHFISSLNTESTTQNSKSLPSNKKGILIQIKDQHTTNNDYVSYIIEINIMSDEHLWFDKVTEKSWSIERRFSEFDLLHSDLIRRYPACLVAPLPSKLSSLNPWSMANQKKDTDFIDSRRQRLEMFLNRITIHPKLSGDPIIFQFLRDKEMLNDISTKKDLSETLGQFVNWRWINVQSSLLQIFDNNFSASYLNELLRSNSLSEESIKLIDRGKQLQDSLKKLINCLSKVEEQTTLLHFLYKNYGEAFFDWCAMDQSIGDTLQSFGHMCDTYSSFTDSSASADKPIMLQQPGSNSGGIYTILSWNEISLLLQELYDFGECWIELGGRMAFMHKQLYRYVTQIDSKEEQLERLKNRQPLKSGGFSSLTNKFKRSMSTSEISQMQLNLEASLLNDKISLETMKKNQELFDQCVEEEIEYFEAHRSRDMHKIMHSYACNQLAHSERCLRLWQRARQTLG